MQLYQFLTLGKDFSHLYIVFEIAQNDKHLSTIVKLLHIIY
jgi:hypothetical protein